MRPTLLARNASLLATIGIYLESNAAGLGGVKSGGGGGNGCDDLTWETCRKCRACQVSING